MNILDIKSKTFILIENSEDTEKKIKIGYIPSGTHLEYIDLDDPTLQKKPLNPVRALEVLLPKNNHLRLANKIQRKDFYANTLEANALVEQWLEMISLSNRRSA